jgi:hypothetical protein
MFIPYHLHHLHLIKDFWNQDFETYFKFLEVMKFEFKSFNIHISHLTQIEMINITLKLYIFIYISPFSLRSIFFFKMLIYFIKNYHLDYKKWERITRVVESFFGYWHMFTQFKACNMWSMNTFQKLSLIIQYVGKEKKSFDCHCKWVR